MSQTENDFLESRAVTCGGVALPGNRAGETQTLSPKLPLTTSQATHMFLRRDVRICSAENFLGIPLVCTQKISFVAAAPKSPFCVSELSVTLEENRGALVQLRRPDTPPVAALSRRPSVLAAAAGGFRPLCDRVPYPTLWTHVVGTLLSWPLLGGAGT